MYKCVNNPSHTYSQNTSDGFCPQAECRGIGYLINETSQITGSPISQSNSSFPSSKKPNRPTNLNSNSTVSTSPAMNVPAKSNSNLIAPIIGIIFVLFLAFFAVRLGINEDNSNSKVNSFNISANINANRIYSNNSVINRKEASYTNINKSNTNSVNTDSSNTIVNTPPFSNSAYTSHSSNCRLYNDKSDETRVYIRSDCDIYFDCDTNPDRRIESLPDNTSIRIIKGVSPIPSKVRPYSWIKVEIVNTGQIAWVANSKVKCN